MYVEPMHVYFPLMWLFKFDFYYQGSFDKLFQELPLLRSLYQQAIP